MDSTHGPIEKKHAALMNAVASALQDTFKGYGFVLFVFDHNTQGRANYISNSERVDVVKTLQQFVQHETKQLQSIAQTPDTGTIDMYIRVPVCASTYEDAHAMLEPYVKAMAVEAEIVRPPVAKP
jgi:hypothetical protein